MKIMKPSLEILTDGAESLKNIELAGRTCYKSTNKITENSCKKFIKGIIERGHESVIEHSMATVRFFVSRSISHELVRHRLAAYSQESTRYVNYGGKDIAFMIPYWIEDIQEGTYNADILTVLQEQVSSNTLTWLKQMKRSEDVYMNLIENGCKPQEARGVLPIDLATQIVVTANYREWRHIFKLRTDRAAHPDIRGIMQKTLSEFKTQIPVVFDDIG